MISLEEVYSRVRKYPMTLQERVKALYDATIMVNEKRIDPKLVKIDFESVLHVKEKEVDVYSAEYN